MHSIFIRANVVFFFALSALFFTAFGCGLSYLYHNPTVSASITNTQVLRFRQFNRAYLKADQAHLRYHVESDLRPLWDWNTKQLFVWVVAEWKSPSRPTRQAVLWDRIIQSKEDSYIKELVDVEYPLSDLVQQLRGRQVTLKLAYDVMPLVGITRRGQTTMTNNSTFNLPTKWI